MCGKYIMERDNRSNDYVLNILNHPYQCNAYVFSWMVVDKRTVLNEDRERVHVRWTAKRGNEIDLIGQLNVAWLLGHSRGSARSVAPVRNIKLSEKYLISPQKYQINAPHVYCPSNPPVRYSIAFKSCLKLNLKKQSGVEITLVATAMVRAKSLLTIPSS